MNKFGRNAMKKNEEKRIREEKSGMENKREMKSHEYERLQVDKLRKIPCVK